jgi:hypothetical protein
MAELDRDDVLARISLADVLTREVGPPKRQGSQWWWPSVDPALEGTGKTPPTHIYTTTPAGVELFKDFTSDRSGTAADVLMIRRSIDFATALAVLAQQAGITSEDRLPAPLPRNRPAPRRPVRPPPAELLAWIDDCTQRLWAQNRPSAVARQWLADRGYTNSCLVEARVGYDLGAHLDSQRPKQVRAEHGIPNMAGVVFPIFNAAGQPAYAQTRSITWTKTSDYPKYVNPTGILNPGIGIWADPDPDPRRRAGAPVIVVEGPTDALAARQAGHDVAGLIGAGRATNPTTAHNLIDVFGPDRPYVIMTDPDRPGRSAGQFLVAHLWHTGATATYRSPPDTDIADWARTLGSQFPRQLGAHLTNALTELTAITHQALTGDPAFIEHAAGGPLEPAVRHLWTEHTDPQPATPEPSPGCPPVRRPQLRRTTAGSELAI